MVDTVVEIPLSGQSLTFGPRGDLGTAEGLPPSLFLAGPENQLAGVAVHSLLGGDCLLSSPVVFSGPPGSGKTHLATGLVGIWRQRSGPRSAVYVPAVDFAHEWTDAIEAQATEEFHRRYRYCGLLVIDDIDVLASKQAVQQELLHTIDATESNGGRMVLTCTTFPAQVAGLLPALESRMVGGLVVPLALPGPDTRLAAVIRFARTRGIDLPREAAILLAEGLPGPLAGLWAAVLHLEMSARVGTGAISEGAVRNYLAEHCKPEPSLRDIAAATARQFSLRLADLRSPSRRHLVVVARDVAMYLARNLTDRSFEQIGRYFNGRDHSTVSHGCWKTAELLKSDASVRRAVDQLRRQLHARCGP